MKNDDGTRPKLLTEHRKESVPASQVSLIQITLDSAPGRRCDKLGTRNRTILSFSASAISLRLNFQIVFIFHPIFLPFCEPKNFRKCHKSSFDSICLSHLKWSMCCYHNFETYKFSLRLWFDLSCNWQSFMSDFSENLMLSICIFFIFKYPWNVYSRTDEIK